LSNEIIGLLLGAPGTTNSIGSGLEARRIFEKKGVFEKMNTNRSCLGFACRIAAFSCLIAGSASMMQAQQSLSVDSGMKTPLFLASESAPFNLFTPASSSSSSSSSSDSAIASDGRFMLSSDTLASSQPPPRRYGRPTYNGTNSNPDGSEKWTFLGGIMLSMPIGNTHKYETPSYDFQVGGGRNFNKNVGVLLEFDYDHFGLQGKTIANENYIYNYCTAAEAALGECTVGPAPTGAATPVDGNNHVWSFTVDPTYTFATEGSTGAYLVAGTGFYHKVTNFTTPTTEQYCYYYCEEITANATFDHYTSNAIGVNGGVGATWKFNKFSNQKFYLEARYVVMFNSQRYGVTSANVATSSLAATDFYPANSNRTTFIPITFGLRF
jgi:Outer membrane protein beta-barrel domain